MGSLHRLRFLRNGERPFGVGAERRRQTFARPASRLRGQDRALAEALDQLRAGVPLNWSQVEDDPEMAVLAALQDAAQECREEYIGYPPPGLKETIFEKLSPSLPEWQPEPVKEPPKS